MNETITNTSRSRLEFILVLVMLGTLTILVGFILFPSFPRSQISPTKDAANYIKESEMFYSSTLEYRRNILSIVIAAFGAWVGAGAAYFFGRENLRESANSLLQLHRQMSGADKLNLIKVRDIPPKPLDSNFNEEVTIEDTIKKLATYPRKLWFISTNTSGKWYLISKEELFLYIKKQLDNLASIQENQTKSYSELNEQIMKMTLKEVVPEIAANNNARFYLEAKLEDNAAEINNRMDAENIFLGIIKDDMGNYVQYFTTSDIRKSLLKI